MKTLVKNVRTVNNLSLYLFGDDVDLDIQSDKIIVGDPPQFIIADCNSTNTVLHTNVATPPGDWTGTKYTYNGTAWAANSDYSEGKPPST